MRRTQTIATRTNADRADDTPHTVVRTPDTTGAAVSVAHPGSGCGILVSMATPPNDLCDSCRNGWEDLPYGMAIDPCECCGMTLCELCYGALHYPWSFPDV